VTLSGFLIAHGGALILPLAVIEGPIVAVVSGFLSACGYLDGRWAVVSLVCGDLAGDLMYYAIGRTGMTALGHRVEHQLAPELRRKIAENATRMLLIGKWTHSIGCLVLIGSGMLRLPLPRFALVNLLATIPKCLVLFGVGYFLNELPPLERHALAAAIGLGILGIASVCLILRRTDRVWVRR
jgi:membrane-associated protein